jgi:predicted outer membrane repeat protein
LWNGGAVSESSKITNSTFTNNSAENGGTVYGSGSITNSTFTNNSAEKGGAVVGGTIVNCTLVNDISGAVDLGTHFNMGEPRFVDAENGDFRLRSDSPAINVGDSSVSESYPFLKDEAGQEIDFCSNG